MTARAGTRPAPTRRARALGAGAIASVHAGLQALLVVGDPVPGTTPSLALLGPASGAAAALALTAITLLLVASTRPLPVLATSTGTVLAALGAMLISPALIALVLVAASALLPAAALGPSPRRRLGDAVRGRPLAWCWWVGAAVLLLALTWAVSLLAGLVLPGPAAAVVTWLVAGATTGTVLSAARQLLPPSSLAAPRASAEETAT